MGQMTDGTECLLCELWKTLTVLTTWTSVVLNAGARLLGRLHDEGQVMNDGDH